MKTFLDSITDFRSLAITGMAKNVGKTECLNRILRMLHDKGVAPAVTSIGVDGESTDAVTSTRKPEITLFEDTVFVTSESFYKSRRLTSEVIAIGRQSTSLGRLVTAKVVTPGKVILSGPPDTAGLRRLIADRRKEGVGLTIVDGALSRLSLGSPAVTDAMILATGAALSPSLREVVAKTAFVCEMMGLPEVPPVLRDAFEDVERGVWAAGDDGVAVDLGVQSALAVAALRERLLGIDEDSRKAVFVAGAVTDRLLDFFRTQPELKETLLVMRDFTCMFAAERSYRQFAARGGRIAVLKGCRLLGLTANPTSPQGYRLDSRSLCDALMEKTGVETIDVLRLNDFS